MRPRTLIWLAALPCAVLAVAVAGARPTRGPAGPHMMLFDPSIPLEPSEH